MSEFGLDEADLGRRVGRLLEDAWRHGRRQARRRQRRRAAAQRRRRRRRRVAALQRQTECLLVRAILFAKEQKAFAKESSKSIRKIVGF